MKITDSQAEELKVKRDKWNKKQLVKDNLCYS